MPEEREFYRKELRNRESQLYRIFYDDKWNKQRDGHSFYKILNNAKNLRIVIERDKRLEGSGNGVRVYYYDQNKIKLKFPLTDREAQSLINKGDMLMMFFFKIESQWFTSYDFWG